MADFLLVLIGAGVLSLVMFGDFVTLIVAVYMAVLFSGGKRR